MPYNNIKVVSLNVNGMNNPVKRSKVLAKLKKEKAKYYFYKKLICLNRSMKNENTLVLKIHSIVLTNLARRGEWLSLFQMQFNLNSIKKLGTKRDDIY